MDRREFLTSASAAAATMTAASTLATAAPAKAAPNDRVVVAMIGVRGRGNSLLRTFAALPTVELKYVVDLDEGVLKSRTDQVASLIGRRPQTLKDFREALDDQGVDAIVLGTPDHWHALPTIMGCQAGKDVYVEKPDGHNIIEGQTMCAAAKKYERIVQLGTQARSGPHVAEAIEYLRSGTIGRAMFAKAWESAKQGSIGHPADSDPPAGVDYNFWLGPAPKRAFNPNRFHGRWRWFFDYGTGDLGNDGVHRLDTARRGLEAALEGNGKKLPKFPTSISSTGGKYYFDDDQEWPDTLLTSFDYPDPGCVMTYEMRVWNPYPMLGESEGSAVFGDQGYVVIGNSRWKAYDAKGKPVKEGSGSYNDVGHAQNFIDCMHSRKRPNADLETVGHPSSMLCHLGNVAWRVGRTVTFDESTYTFGKDTEANRYLTREEYRKPWVLPTEARL